MTAESKELYNYVTGVEPFCSEVSELQAKKESLSYNDAEKILINITERADRQYTKDYCTKKSCFTEFNYYEIMYRILCEMCNFDTSIEKSSEQKIREYLDENHWYKLVDIHPTDIPDSKPEITVPEKEKEGSTVSLGTMLELFDDWNGKTRVNDDSLNLIVEDRTVDIYDKRKDLLERTVLAYGMYDGVFTVRLAD